MAGYTAPDVSSGQVAASDFINGLKDEVEALSAWVSNIYRTTLKATPSGTGFITVGHGLGAVPVGGVASVNDPLGITSGSPPLSATVGNFTGTTCQVRIWSIQTNGTGAPIRMDPYSSGSVGYQQPTISVILWTAND